MEESPTKEEKTSRAAFFRKLIPKLIIGFVALTVVGLAGDAAQSKLGGWGIFLVIVGAVLFGLGCLLAQAVWRDRLAYAVIKHSRLDAEKVMTGGDRVAVSGVISIEGAPLQSPFSQQQCAAYSYRVSGTRRSYEGSNDGQSRMQNSMLGFHMREAVLEAADMSLKLMALPESESDLFEAVTGGEWGKQAREWLDKLCSDAPQYTSEPVAFGAQYTARESAQLPLAQDFLISNVETNSDQLTVEEACLPIGEPVCLIGHYEALDQGLSGRKSSDGQSGLIYYLGTADEVLSRLADERRKWLPVSVGMIVVGGALLGWPFLPFG
ncbi:MAG: hypothetical protein AAGI44_02980 [Pseudomonadota bacterium]